MAKLKFTDNFTIEVPLQDGTFDIIKGRLLPATKQFEKDLKLKYEDNTNEAKKLQKLNKKLIRLNQEIDNLNQRAEYKAGDDKVALLETIQLKLNEAYVLSDEVEQLNETLQEFDPQEVRATEHINARVKCDEENQRKIDAVVGKYGYKIVFDTILEDIETGKQKQQKD